MPAHALNCNFIQVSLIHHQRFGSNVVSVTKLAKHKHSIRVGLLARAFEAWRCVLLAQKVSLVAKAIIGWFFTMMTRKR